jgi:hypothetical protein
MVSLIGDIMARKKGGWKLLPPVIARNPRRGRRGDRLMINA